MYANKQNFERKTLFYFYCHTIFLNSSWWWWANSVKCVWLKIPPSCHFLLFPEEGWYGSDFLHHHHHHNFHYHHHHQILKDEGRGGMVLIRFFSNIFFALPPTIVIRPILWRHLSRDEHRCQIKSLIYYREWKAPIQVLDQTYANGSHSAEEEKN